MQLRQPAVELNAFQGDDVDDEAHVNPTSEDNQITAHAGWPVLFCETLPERVELIPSGCCQWSTFRFHRLPTQLVRTPALLTPNSPIKQSPEDTQTSYTGFWTFPSHTVSVTSAQLNWECTGAHLSGIEAIFKLPSQLQPSCEEEWILPKVSQLQHKHVIDSVFRLILRANF